jgi:DNA-binding phage protein
MKRKFIAYAMLPILGAGILGMSAANAHPLFGVGSKATPEEIATRQQDMFQKQADLLGISVDKIKEGWASGKDIMQIAEENGVTKDQLKQKMKDAAAAQMKTELQALVTKGVITQAQADQRLKVMQEKAAGKGGVANRFGGARRGAGGLF